MKDKYILVLMVIGGNLALAAVLCLLAWLPERLSIFIIGVFFGIAIGNFWGISRTGNAKNIQRDNDPYDT